MSRLTSKYNLSASYPRLAQEWHPSRNGALKSNDVTPMSHRKVWWLCNKGHEWESIISNRSQHGRGCPYCVNQRAYKDNCLANVNPELANQWHPIKNGKLTPSDITPGSSRKKVWWQCKKGHEWQSLVKSRSNGCGCPYCSGKAVCKDNCLATKYSELAKEWHAIKNGKLTPADVTSGSGKKVWWFCAAGHEYKAAVGNRSKGQGCPYCSNQKVCIDNCLASKNPNLAKEWHPSKNEALTPWDVTPGANKKVWWLCSKDHEWKTTLGSRLGGSGCPICCRRQTSTIELRIYSELKYVFPDTRLRERLNKVECDIYIPSVNVAVEYDGEYWHRNRHKQDRYKNSVLENYGIKLIRIREKGLEKVDENDVVYDYSKKGYKQLINSLLQKIDLSNLSSFQKARVRGYLKKSELANNDAFIMLLDLLPSPFPGNSFADKKPQIAKEWHPSKNGVLTPMNVTPRSNKNVWWQCHRGHEWEAGVNNRFAGHGCPYCAGQRVSQETCLAARNPELASEWHPNKNGELTPLNVMPGSHKKVWWQCKKGHEYACSVVNKSKGYGCPYCIGKRKKYRLAPPGQLDWHFTKNELLATVRRSSNAEFSCRLTL